MDKEQLKSLTESALVIAGKAGQRILEIYDLDNSSVWDCRPDGHYVRRRPEEGEPVRAAQDMLSEEATGGRGNDAVSLKQVS